MQFLFACQESSRKLAAYELGRYDASFALAGWLDAETGLGETSLDTEALSRLLRGTPVLFVRHIFRVDAVWPSADWKDMTVGFCRERLDVTRSFAIQMRVAKDAGIPQRGLSDAAAAPLVQDGCMLDVRRPEQIVSVFLTAENAYVGLDTAEHNLSRYRGGMPHWAHGGEYDFVSRAEFKLIDALETFGIDLTGRTAALDLGAAPGGWTKALSERGLRVDAVDPVSLDASVAARKGVEVYRMTAEKFLSAAEVKTYDIIVNDMKMDVEKSLRVIASCRGRLKEGGIVVMTFKLPHVFSYKSLRENLAWLRGFELTGARQLYENRSEITAVYRKL